MANEYSVAIHNFISDKIAAAENNNKDAAKENDLASARYYEGQLLELYKTRQYLNKKIDLKTQKYY
ncbi:hypothetical protein D1BOALGB6SA_3301 [Olavius sp. associated proteobacterium Delta 1]|nr:hypothetical protein D1BOALGB6SA_3301 [Olavius sp. associated proteobacterium Delta 1]